MTLSQIGMCLHYSYTTISEFLAFPSVILFETYDNGPGRPKRASDKIKQLRYPNISVHTWCALVTVVSDCEAEQTIYPKGL